MALPALIRLYPAAKLAFDNRDKAIALLRKWKQWRNQGSDSEGTTLPAGRSVVERLDALEKHTLKTVEFDEEQSNLIAEISDDLEELAKSADYLRRQVNIFAWIGLASLLISILALVFALAS